MGFGSMNYASAEPRFDRPFQVLSARGNLGSIERKPLQYFFISLVSIIKTCLGSDGI